MSLYFIALLPPENLLKQIKKIKEELAEKHGPKHALRLPGHITLIPPFRREEEEDESLLLNLFESFSKQQQPFNLKFDGFGAFRPRVIYIKVQKNEILFNLQEKLRLFLENGNIIEPKDNPENFRPHITIASRDLKRRDFKKIWQEYKDQDFSGKFEVDSLCLFKQLENRWRIYREFKF